MGKTSNTSIDGIKSMTNDLDNVMLVLKSEFDQQKQLCKDFRDLASLYRPLRMDAVATVVSLKDFADTTDTMCIPMLKNALDDGSAQDAKEVVDELVEMFSNVNDKMEDLKVQHDKIAIKARQLGEKAAEITQEHGQKTQSQGNKGDGQKTQSQGNKGDLTAETVGAGGGVGLAVAAVTMIAVTGSGPIGWFCLAGAGLVTAGAAGKVTYENAGKVANEKPCENKDQIALNDALRQSAAKINLAMATVTSRLDHQVEAMIKIVNALSGQGNMSTRLKKVVDSWCEGNAKSTQDKIRLEGWLRKFPVDMAELSKYCQSYLGDDCKNQARIMDAMKCLN